VRDQIRQLLAGDRAPEDRIDGDGPASLPQCLAGEVIRLARLATAVHVFEAARIAAGPDRAAAPGGRGDRES
jgi:hypothetical protein